jgi:hypothetical protein
MSLNQKLPSSVMNTIKNKFEKAKAELEAMDKLI